MMLYETYKHKYNTDIAFQVMYMEVGTEDDYSALFLQGYWINIAHKSHRIIGADEIVVRFTDAKNWEPYALI